jgi:fatty acid-binding protein DegV
LTNDGRGGRVNHWSANVHLQRGEAEQIAARIVSDHTQAAAVPKLVEALQRRVSPTKCYCDVMLGAKCGECADRELLTSLGAQIQEKQ